jgi:hypothetical protein
MAITENTFTKDELAAVITAKPELVTLVTEVLTTSAKLKVLKDEEFAAAVTKAETDAINRTTSEIYNNIDKDLESLGFKKDSPEEKTYERNKKVITSLHEKVKDLEEKAKNSSGDAILKQQLEAAQAAEATAKANLEQLQKDYKTEKVRTHVKAGTSGKSFRKDFPDILIKRTIEAEEESLINSADTTTDGKIYFKGQDGKAILKTGTSDFATATDILNERLKDLFDDGGGAGSGSGSTKPTTGANTGIKNPEGKDIVVPAEITTKVALHEYLKKQGLTTTSKEFIEIDKKYKDLPLR